MSFQHVLGPFWRRSVYIGCLSRVLLEPFRICLLCLRLVDAFVKVIGKSFGLLDGCHTYTYITHLHTYTFACKYTITYPCVCIACTYTCITIHDVILLMLRKCLKLTRASCLHIKRGCSASKPSRTNPVIQETLITLRFVLLLGTPNREICAEYYSPWSNLRFTTNCWGSYDL